MTSAVRDRDTSLDLVIPRSLCLLIVNMLALFLVTLRKKEMGLQKLQSPYELQKTDHSSHSLHPSIPSTAVPTTAVPTTIPTTIPSVPTLGGNAFVRHCIDMVGNVPCKDIVDYVRSKYEKCQVKKTVLSDVRTGYLSLGNRPDAYLTTSSLLRDRALQTDIPEECRRKTLQFLDGYTLTVQYYTIRNLKRRQWCSGHHEIDRMLREVVLVPHDFEDLVLSPEEGDDCKAAQDAQLLEKHVNVVVISNPWQMLEAMRKVVRNAAAYVGPHSSASQSNSNPPSSMIQPLGAALLGLSGRRFVEIFNCKSTFRPVHDEDGNVMQYMAVFTGQVKTKAYGAHGTHDARADGYVIPILVEYGCFRDAYSIFCKLQLARLRKRGRVGAGQAGEGDERDEGDERGERDEKESDDKRGSLQNKEFNNQNHALREWITHTKKGTHPPQRLRPEYRNIKKVKQLREVYVAYVKSLFATTWGEGQVYTSNVLVFATLGHEYLRTSMNYTTAQLEWEMGKPGETLGVFPPRHLQGEVLSRLKRMRISSLPSGSF